MELMTAIHLISGGVAEATGPQIWAELGAGEGFFTRALSARLPAGSYVHAFDRDAAALRQIRVQEGVNLHTMPLDFVKQELDLPPLDGLLMANALHYVKDQETFLKRLRKHLKPDGRLVVVEYDTDTPNTWVPYPLSYTSLQRLAERSGFRPAKHLASAPSRYQGSMYSAIVVF